MKRIPAKLTIDGKEFTIMITSTNSDFKPLLFAFLACLFLAAISGYLFLYYPASDALREKVATVGILLGLITAATFYDLIAFERGATATISQVILGWVRSHPWFGPLLLFGFGVLAGHLMLAHDPGIPRSETVLAYVLRSLPLIALGMVVGTTLLSQQSNKDATQ